MTPAEELPGAVKLRMRNVYYGSFVPGMQDVIAEAVRERLEDAVIIKLLDGAIVFETGCSYDRLNFFCFNNIFAVIDILDIKPDAGAPLELHMEKISGKGRGLPEKALAIISANNNKIRTFRVVCSAENKPASVNEKLRQDTENFIVRNSALKVDRTTPDTEFWFLCRREGFSLFMKRLTRPASNSLRPGELSPQLAWLLCRVASLRPEETVMDPFCGYGAIPEAALKHYPIKKFFALDMDRRCAEITRSRRALGSERCEIRRADVFLEAGTLPQGGVDAIVTDPPWGIYRETDIPIEKFYEKILVLFSAVLTKNGRAVVLTGAGDALLTAMGETGIFKTDRMFPVLVSGRKAMVFHLERR